MVTKYLTTRQVMKQLHLSRPDAIYRWILSGKLRAYQLGADHNLTPTGQKSRKHYRFTQEDVDAFVKAGGTVQDGTTL